MNISTDNKWHEVWTRKGTESGDSLEDLMKADGFDTGTGAISVDDWMKTSTDIKPDWKPIRLQRFWKLDAEPEQCSTPFAIPARNFMVQITLRH